MSNEKQRHHIVTEAYLSQWRDPKRPGDPRVWVFEKSAQEGQLRHPNRILVERNYFTEVEPEGERHTQVEDRLAREVEGPAMEVLRSVECGSVLSPSDRGLIWKFVTTMFARTAWWRKPLLDLVERGVREAPSKAVDRAIASMPLNRAARRKAARCRRLIVAEVSKAPTLKTFAESLKTKIHPMLVAAALDFEEVQEYPFSLFRVDRQASLISSDTPCFLEDRSVLGLPLHPGYVMTCPLTPRVAFVGGLHLAQGYVVANLEWARKFNARVRSNADRWLVAVSADVNEAWFLDDPDWPPTFREVAARSLKNLR